jgi:hypothetical protein
MTIPKERAITVGIIHDRHDCEILRVIPSPVDSPGGRILLDTSSAYILSEHTIPFPLSNAEENILEMGNAKNTYLNAPHPKKLLIRNRNIRICLDLMNRTRLGSKRRVINREFIHACIDDSTISAEVGDAEGGRDGAGDDSGGGGYESN